MDTDFRFACAECCFGCAGDGGDKYWNLKAKKRICKNVTKNFYLSYL